MRSAPYPRRASGEPHPPRRRATARLLLSGIIFFAAASARAEFVTVEGDQFVLHGQVYKLKGTNYYPKNHMWANMWTGWNWGEITFETGLIRDLGMNCVRILVPYSHGGWGGANPPEHRLQQLEDLVNLMGTHGIRSVVTLFDWETSFPAAGTSREAQHLSHLTAIVTRLRDNPYVLFWDVKNEPDHPANYGWCDCNPGACGDWDCNPLQRDRIVSWLERMCNAVRAMDPNHPVSAGMRWWQNLPDVLDFVDVAIFHSYWVTLAEQQIIDAKAYMGAQQKPIVVEEYGWPSHPSPAFRSDTGTWQHDFTEQHQLDFYVAHLAAFEKHGIAGGLQWMTFDAKFYSNDPYDSFEHYFGLWRATYTLKPAGAYYRDHFPVAMFPTVPPDPVVALNAEPMGGRIELAWTNPSTPGYTGTMVRYDTATHPAGPDQGTLLHDGAAAPGSTIQVTHAQPSFGVTYHYSAFAYNHNGQFAPPTHAQTSMGIAGDFDGDFDVDMADFGFIQACLSGSAVPHRPECIAANLDGDSDVDQDDMMILLRCLSGPGVPADPDCAY